MFGAALMISILCTTTFLMLRKRIYVTWVLLHVFKQNNPRAKFSDKLKFFNKTLAYSAPELYRTADAVTRFPPEYLY